MKKTKDRSSPPKKKGRLAWLKDAASLGLTTGQALKVWLGIMVMAGLINVAATKTQHIGREEPSPTTKELDALKAKLSAFENELATLKNTPKTTPTPDVASALRKLGTPVGTILPFIGDPKTLAGTGWILCDEENSNRYPGVPNLSDRFLVGTGTDKVGSVGGRKDIPPDGTHQHGKFTGELGSKPGGSPGGWVQGSGGKGAFWLPDYLALHKHTVAIDGQHNHGGDNRPPYYAVYFIIRVK